MPHRPVVVSLGASDYPTTVEIRDHVVRSDEPVSRGGTDSGPEPTELLLASLGACTVITLRMYARRKGWTLSAARAEVAFHEDDGRRSIRMSVSCEGALGPEQRARLLQIAKACPVHKMLSGGVVVETSLAGVEEP